MPLYEYRCNSCGEVFDKLRPFSRADQDVRCPRCGSEATERQLSTFSAGGCGGSGSSGRFR
ncbi:MAG: zinc ribbon domain-containing protein [Bryobacterales bacterium]|nr:zinc ribbon domain-containing protein [Bryobacterales bacterium]